MWEFGLLPSRHTIMNTSDAVLSTKPSHTLLREVSSMFFFICSIVPWSMIPWSVVLRRNLAEESSLLKLSLILWKTIGYVFVF